MKELNYPGFANLEFDIAQNQQQQLNPILEQLGISLKDVVSMGTSKITQLLKAKNISPTSLQQDLSNVPQSRAPLLKKAFAKLQEIDDEYKRKNPISVAASKPTAALLSALSKSLLTYLKDNAVNLGFQNIKLLDVNRFSEQELWQLACTFIAFLDTYDAQYITELAVQIRHGATRTDISDSEFTQKIAESLTKVFPTHLKIVDKKPLAFLTEATHLSSNIDFSTLLKNLYKVLHVTLDQLKPEKTTTTTTNTENLQTSFAQVLSSLNELGFDYSLRYAKVTETFNFDNFLITNQSNSGEFKPATEKIHSLVDHNNSFNT